MVKGLSVMHVTTLAEFRKMAKNLNARVNEISKGLSRFSNRGLAEAEVLIRQARQSINRIDRVISDFEKNPSGHLLSENREFVR